MKKNYIKIISSCMLVLCMAVAMVFTVLHTKANDRLIQYKEGYKYSSTTYKDSDGDGIAPATPEELTNYLFAGWFQSEDGKTYQAVSNPVDGETYYAKFVPGEVLGIQAQVSANVLDEETSDKAKNAIRLVTSLDSTDYRHIGFNIRKGDGTAYDANTTKKVYTELYAVGATEATEDNKLTYTPDNTFHSQSEYFKTWTINKVPETAFNTDITVIPYWITLDGTRVEGTTAIKTVNLGRAWIYVDAKATESAQLGTYNAPYTAISDAVGCQTKLSPTVILKNDMDVTEKITLDKDVTVTSEGDVTLTRGSDFTSEFFNVPADFTLTLKSMSEENMLILDGAKSVLTAEKPLVNTSGAIVINDGVVLQNNATTSSVNGGAICLNEKAKLTMTGGILKGNIAGSNGGAIHADVNSTMDLNNVELSGNTAGGQGGAINLPGGGAGNLMKLTDVKIKNNVAETKSSGAIYVGASRQLELNGENTEISGNTATTYGGAIGMGNNAIVTMNAGTIRGNTASGGNGGGAIYVNASSEFTMNGGNISENTAKGTFGGGAIYGALSAKITIEDGTIEKNEALNGGAIYLIGNDDSTGATLSIKGGNIRENGANLKTTGLGGAIYMGTLTKFTMTGGTISSNEAITSKGEGVYCLGSTFEIGGDANLNDEVYLGNDTPITVTSELTNAVRGITRYEYAEDAMIATNAADVEADLTDKFELGTVTVGLTVAEGKVTLNKVTSTGVGTYDALSTAITEATGDVTIEITADIEMAGTITVPSNVNITLIGTGALTRGTGCTGEFFNIPSGSTLTMAGMGKEKTLTLSGGYDSKDTSTQVSKPLIINAGTLNVMEDVVLKDNYNKDATTNRGGAILTSGTLNISGGTIQNTHGAGNYGSVAVNSGTFNMTGGLITQGTMRGVNVISGTFTLDGGSVTGNVQASGSGAGVLITTGAHKLIMKSGTISYNEATTNAGGINLGGENATMDMSGGTIRGNIAKGTSNNNGGGAIYMSGNTKLTITGGSIKDNEAKGAYGGGAIYAGRSKGIAISGGTISGNQATHASAHGGAICLNGATTLTMTGGNFKDNTAGKNGGAIHAAIDSTIDLSNVELSGNTAGGQGGAINLPGSSAGNLMKLTNVKIENNTATTASSGAIYVGASRQLQISGVETEISGNTAATYGGAIGTGASATVTINDVTISGNTAKAGNGGGGIYLTTSVSFTMNGGTISGNTAATYGGAIYLGDSVNLTMTGATLKRNTSEKDGGAIYAAATSTMELSNVELSGNTAGGQGGAINLPGGEGNLMKLTDVKINDNVAETKSSGAIYVGASRQLQISGDNTEISGNTAYTYGGAIGTGDGATVTMNGGIISGNTAIANDRESGGGGVFVNENVIFNMNGGIIKDNQVRTGVTGENIYFNGNTLTLSGAAQLASVYSEGKRINVTAPLTDEGAITEIILGTIPEDEVVVEYIGENAIDMAALREKFSCSGYELIVEDTYLKVHTINTYAELEKAVEGASNT